MPESVRNSLSCPVGSFGCLSCDTVDILVSWLHLSTFCWRMCDPPPWTRGTDSRVVGGEITDTQWCQNNKETNRGTAGTKINVGTTFFSTNKELLVQQALVLRLFLLWCACYHTRSKLDQSGIIFTLVMINPFFSQHGNGTVGKKNVE